MSIEVLGIVDTAVKIGLGAAISGLATYLVTKLNHNKAAEKERTEKRRQLIEDVAERIEGLFALLFSYRAGVHEWVNAKEDGRELNKERLEYVLALQKDIPRAYREITSSEAKLLLIGAKRAQHLIRDFGEDISYLREGVRPGNQHLSIAEVEVFRETLLKHRYVIFEELAVLFDA